MGLLGPGPHESGDLSIWKEGFGQPRVFKVTLSGAIGLQIWFEPDWIHFGLRHEAQGGHSLPSGELPGWQAG